MIPKKLFSPKCLHPNREQIFKDDLENFYNLYLVKLFSTQTFNKEEKTYIVNENINFYFLNSNYITNFENPLKNDSVFDIEEIESKLILNNNLTYSFFKKIWAEKEFSLLHFTKDKEENINEYYQCLFREVQKFLFPQNERNIISKIFSIYCLYSLYFTQPHKIKFKINTIIESLKSINMIINYLQIRGFISEFEIILKMVNKLYEVEAFRIGVLFGIKSILLNRYGLPLEGKSESYDNFKSLFNSQEKLNKEKQLDNLRKEKIKNLTTEYSITKVDLINEIKDLFNEK